jgi:short-subunit dehydrogenase
MGKGTFNIGAKLRKNLSKINLEYGLAVITGASSGIGEAIAALLLEHSPNVLVFNLSRTPSSLDSNNLINVECDLSDSAQIDAAFDEILRVRKERRLDAKKLLLVNNSGFGGYGFFPEPDLAHNVGMLDVNVRALTYMCGKFVPIFRESGGGVVNVASTAAFQPCPYLSVYAASKAYVLNFSLALDWELRKYGCTCLCLCPGPTGTNFFRRAGFEKRPLKTDFGHTARQVAESCLSAYAKGRNLKVVGKLNFLQSVMINFIPRVWVGALAGRVLSIFRN